jgi:thiamine-phosphate pyrophosphorylase
VKGLADHLRLIVITDRELAKPRSIETVVEEVLKAGVPAIQLRDKGASSRDLLTQAFRLRRLTADYGALLFVNDRFDVALAAGADGVHLGPHDLPVGPVRASSPPGFLIGASTDDPDEARSLEAEGADYLGCGAVFPTTSKLDAGEAIGVEGLARVVSSVRIPVVGIGGINPDGVLRIAAGSRAAGVAVIGAVMAAENPGLVSRKLMTPFGGASPPEE